MSSGKLNLTPILFFLLIIASFFLGSLWTKTQYLEKQQKALAQNTNQQADQAPQGQVAGEKTINKDNIKSWAKDIGLDTNKFNSCFDNEKYKQDVDKDSSDGKLAGVSGTPAFFINGHLVSGALPFSVFKNIIDFELSGGDWNNPDPTVKDLIDKNQIAKNAVNVSKGALPSLGKDNAKIQIIEFSDFQCPFCKRFHDDSFAQIKKEYIDTGKVSFSYRHFPLEFHQNAAPFALASECANEQGKFWEFEDKIFQEQ